MLSIGNKKYRNLQEQVGYNTECIQKLAEAIDGITLEDKLVIIANDSGTFSENEMTVLSGPLAFISDGSKVWLKQSETPTEFVFKAIDIIATEQGGTHYNVGGSKIVVTRATRAYVTSDDVIIVTYNKSQMDSLLALKANLSGADFSGPITATSITEIMAGYGFIPETPSNWTLEYVYASAVKTGNKITFVLSLNLTKSAGASNFPAIANFSMPVEVYNKLYPTRIGDYSWLDVRVLNAFYTENANVAVPARISKGATGRIGIQINGANMVEGTTYYLRYEATFLLSDNLAQ